MGSGYRSQRHRLPPLLRYVFRRLLANHRSRKLHFNPGFKSGGRPDLFLHRHRIQYLRRRKRPLQRSLLPRAWYTSYADANTNTQPFPDAQRDAYSHSLGDSYTDTNSDADAVSGDQCFGIIVNRDSGKQRRLHSNRVTRKPERGHRCGL